MTKLTLGKRLANNLLAQYQSTFFSPMGVVFVDELAEVRLRGFALAFDRLAKAGPFFRGFLLVVVVLFVVAQVRDQLIQAMRNSDSRVSIVFIYRFNSNFHSIFTLQVSGCDF